MVRRTSGNGKGRISSTLPRGSYSSVVFWPEAAIGCGRKDPPRQYVAHYSQITTVKYRVAVALAVMLSLIVNSSIMAQRATTTGNRKKPSTTSTSQHRKRASATVDQATTGSVGDSLAEVSHKKAQAATNQTVTGSPEAVIPPPTSPTKEYVYVGGRLIATEEPIDRSMSHSTRRRG